MRDRRNPEEISRSLNPTQTIPVKPTGINADCNKKNSPTEFTLDSRAARFFSWLGNHFFGVTLVLTAGFLVWALR